MYPLAIHTSQPHWRNKLPRAILGEDFHAFEEGGVGPVVTEAAAELVDAQVDLLQSRHLGECFAYDLHVADGAAIRGWTPEDEIERDVLDVVGQREADVDGLGAVAIAGAGEEEVPVHVFVEEVASLREDRLVEDKD